MSRGRQGVAEERRQSLGTMAELPRESSSCEGRTVIEEDQFQRRDRGMLPRDSTEFDCQ